MSDLQATSSVDAARKARGPKLWRPKRLLVTPAALAHAHGQSIVARAEAEGIPVTRLKVNRLSDLTGEDARRTYVKAKSTLAVVVAPPTKLRLQPIPPSADWRVDLAEGCPAHCQYCYLAGSLSGPPVTRAYANLPEILDNLAGYVGRGAVTSRSEARAHEGTTFEASCYTDPLGIEHLIGSLAAAIEHFGRWDAPVQLRFTTKFDAVEPLLDLDHNGRTRARFSVNAAPVVAGFEGGTAGLDGRLSAMAAMARAGYPVGLTVAPIMAVEGWRDLYADLIERARAALAGIPDLDLTAELITHRFTPGSKSVLLDWYPATQLDLDETTRARKMTKYGSLKFVYTAEVMGEMKRFFYERLADRLPQARVLYWT